MARFRVSKLSTKGHRVTVLDCVRLVVSTQLFSSATVVRSSHGNVYTDGCGRVPVTLDLRTGFGPAEMCRRFPGSLEPVVSAECSALGSAPGSPGLQNQVFCTPRQTVNKSA